MEGRAFVVFQQLLDTVFQKAFGEPLSPLSHSRAQALSWYIEEDTGCRLSYKTLVNYADAAVACRQERINPTVTTLNILVNYASDNASSRPLTAWWSYLRTHLQMAEDTGS